MKMEDLEKRIEFWNKGYVAARQGKSNPSPYRATPAWTSIYLEKIVLEIGPGEGRQADVLMQLASAYCVADISMNAMHQKKYKNCCWFLLTGENDNLETTFDTICFWYVLHHIKYNESVEFFNFLHRHLYSPESRIHFNYPKHPPGDSKLSDEFDGDGMKTTFWNYSRITDILSETGFKVVHHSEDDGVIEASIA